MSDANKTTGLQLRSRIAKSGDLELSLAKVDMPEPGPDQVLVKVEATPINPSDLGLLLGPADMTSAQSTGSGDHLKVTAKVPATSLPFLAARLDEAMPVGNEGAGTVIKAGSSEAAQALKGKTVSMVGGGMYAQYRLLKATDCQPLPAGTSAAEGASWFVNARARSRARPSEAAGPPKSQQKLGFLLVPCLTRHSYTWTACRPRDGCGRF